MKTVLKDKILKGIKANEIRVKNKLSIVAADIHLLRKYDEDVERINESQSKVAKLQGEISTWEKVIATFTQEHHKETIAQVKELLEVAKRDLDVENQTLELSSMIHSYDFRKNQLEEDVKELKKMLKVWEFTLKFSELSEEQLLAYDYAKGKIKI